MNKIYKVVWSKVRNAYVVVSEVAKSHSRNKSQSGMKVTGDLLRLAVVSSLVVGSAWLNPMTADATNQWGARVNFDNDTTAVSGTARADGRGAVAVGTATATGEDALALGTDASATGTETVAIGGATSGYNYAIAMGAGAFAGGTYSVGGVTQSGENAIAIGRSALAYGLNDVVVGANQTAIAPTTTASEDTPEGTGLSSALGGRVMIGHDNIAYGRAGNSVIVGSNNRSNAIHGIAIGQNAYAGQPDGSTLAYENTMFIGTNTRSYSTDAIAIGNNAVAGNTDTSRTSYDGNGLAAAAIGSGAKATSFHTVAIGSGSQATDISAAAIGDGALASATSTSAFGEAAKATSVGSLAAGAASVANNQYTTAVGNSAQATGLRSLAVGFTAVASGGGAIAQGTNAQATSSYTMALGYDTVASAGSSMAIGYQAKAVGGRSISIGREATAGTVSTGPESIAIGYQASSTAGNAIAIGKGSTIDGSATTAVALGDTSAANAVGSVAIGANSVASRAADTTGGGWNNQDSTWRSWLSTKGNAGTTTGGAWNSTSGVVSIGTDGANGTALTRKLTGLAAGQYDTDAVNMKQWTNTMLATTGDFKDSSYTTTYGSDGTPRTVTKLLNQSLKITGGVDNTLYYQSDFAAQPNIGAIISDNTVTLRLNKTLRGLETIYLTNPTTGNATTVSGNGVTIRPKSGSNVTLTTAGLNNGGNKITNVAAGTAGTDGVNVSQLNQAIADVSGGSGTTTTVTVEGGTAAGTSGTYTGNNLQLTSTTGTGTATYDLKLADNVTLGSTGTSGTNGSLTVNGTGGSSVAVDGATGSVALTGTDGSTATITAGTSANDVNGNSINRITAGGQTVATLNDGMVYTGDTGTAAVKLNKTVNIVGGETDSSKLSTDNNIGIVAAQDGDNGKLTVRLAKDITGLNTVEAGDAVLGNQGVVTAGGVAQDGSYVTGLDNTTWNVTNPDIVTGRAATEDQLKTVSDAVTAVSDGTSANATGGFGLTDDSGTAVKQDLGKTIQVAGDGNVTTTAGDGKITVGLSNTVALGDKGTTDGSMTVNGADGSSVAINGSNGSIVMNTADGSPVTIQAGTSANDVTGSPVNRITVGGQTVATLNDGMKYGGDFGTVSNVKLNNQVDVKGEAATEADLTTGNIGVVSSQAGDNGLLTVKLNKDINLGSTGSLTFGSGDNTVSLSNSGLNNGGNKITNVATGTDGTDAVNVDQLTKAIAGVSAGEGSKTNLTVEGGTAAGTGGNYAGSNLQITEKTETTGATTYDVKLADTITLGSETDSAAGTEGTDGSITVNGKDGSSVAINGADGSIALNTADGSPVTIQAGTSANNLAGNPVDRITVGGQTVATMSDGLKFAGDDGQSDTTKVIPKTLNEQLDIVGGAEGELTDKNIGVNNVNGQLKVQLVKDVDLGSTGSLTLGNTVVNNNGITITPATGDPVSLTGSGLDNGNNVISNVATGVKGTDAVNVDQLTKAIAGVSAGEGSKTNLTVEGGTAAGTSGNYTGSNLQVTEKTETTGATTYDVKLADNITLGSAADSAAGTEGTDSSITVNGKAGSAVAINGADGSIALNTADGSPVTIKAGTAANDVNGNSIDRVTVGGATVATLDDGMVYTGDTGSVTTGNTVVNNDGVKVGDTALTSGGLTITNGPSVTTGGIDGGSKQITNVASGYDGVDADGNPTYNNLTNGANIGDIKNITDAAKTELTNDGLNFTADSGDSVHRNLGETLNIAGDGNITTTSDATNGKITVGLSNTLSVGTRGKDGEDGSVTVNGKDGSSVVINGKDSSIGLTGPANGDRAPGKTITIKGVDGIDGVKGVDGKVVDRIVVNDQTVATLNDGQKYAGDNAKEDGTNVIAKKLNEQLDIVGGADADKLTENNIGVNNVNGKLKVQLVKDVNLGDEGSLRVGSAVLGKQKASTASGISQTGTYLTGLDNTAWNTTNPDAVSGRAATEDQLKALNDKVNTISTSTGGGEFGLTADSGDAVKQNLCETIQIAGDGQNITTTADAANGKITVGLSNNLSIGAKDGSDGTDGVDGKIGINGKDGSSVVINGKDGSIGLTGPAGADGTPGTTVNIKVGPSVDDVNGSPVDRITVGGNTVATLSDGMKYGGDFGNTSKVKLNNQVNVKGNATNEADLTDGNIGVVSSQDSDNGQLLIKLNKDLNLSDKGSVTIGNTVINNSGVTIGSGTSAVSLTDKGLNNGGNQITNVASGTTGKTYDNTKAGQENWNNAANIGDLNTAINDIKGQANGGFGLTADDGKSVKQDLGQTITVAGDKNIETKVTDDGKLQVGLKDNIDLGQKGSITAGNTTIDKEGVATDKITVKDSGISIDKDGINAGNTVIKNVGSGLGNNYDTSVEGQENYNNGANIGNVYNIAKGQAEAAKAQSGKNITVDKNNKVNLNNNITLGDNTDPAKQVNIDGNGATVTAGSGDNQVKLDGSKGHISAGGVVLGNQDNTAGDSNPATGSYLTGLDNTKWDGQNIQSGRAATEDQLKAVDDKITGGRVFEGDDGADNKVSVGLGDTLKLNGGADASNLSSGNIGVVKNANGDGLDIKLVKDLTGLDSVTTGNATINNSGVTIKTVDSDRTITIQDSNINMGNNVVSGVADGVVAPGSTDAINGSQLAQRDQAINNIGGAVNKLDNRINKVGAGAAALAALHPQDFDPDDKWDFAFGYGNYNGASAGALGAFYKPNEDTTFSIGGTIGGGENMINAGVSFKLGQGNNVSNSRVGVAKEVRDLRAGMAKLEELVNNQNAVINRQSELINQLTGQNPGRLQEENSELFPDVPDNHWAYEYVTKLHELGIIEGYPDGTFGGDRMMTRYEFATIVYRAIMAGAASNAALKGDNTLSRLAKEFSPELKYIRIDTVRKDKDGNPTIQRVRIVPENKDKY